MASAESLSDAEVARRCQEETQNYFAGAANDERFCFELLRRALADRSNVCFLALYFNYKWQVVGWIKQGVAGRWPSEPLEGLVDEAFFRLFQNFAGARFVRLESLPAALKYLRRCAISVAIEAQRRDRSWERRHQAASQDSASAGGPAPMPDRRQIWARIQELCPDPADRLLCRLSMQLGYKPAEISDLYPDHWPTGQDVSQRLHRVRARLHKDSVLRALLQLDEADD